MPIRTTTVDRQRTLAGLAKAVFDTGNRPELIEKAVEALRHANPQLGEDAALKSGMTLFVPRIEGMKLGAAKAQAGDEALAELALERANSFAQLAGKPLDAAIAAAQERAKDTLSPETLKAILQARPDVEKQIKAMQEGTAREAERIQAAVTNFRVTIKTIVKDLQNRASGADF